MAEDLQTAKKVKKTPVFDGKKQVPQPYVEDDPVNPLSEYGRSKLAGEEHLQINCPDTVILRTAWLYSANGPNFLKTMLRLALSDPNRAFTIVNDQLVIVEQLPKTNAWLPADSGPEVLGFQLSAEALERFVAASTTKCFNSAIF